MAVPTVSWSETTPAGSENLNQGDNRIKEFKTQMREILEVDHEVSSSGQGDDWGKHNKVSLLEQANLGTGATGKPILGAQTVNSKAELVFTDEDDNDVVLTRDGKVAIDSVFRSGDLLFTSSSTVPTNFTDVSSTYDNKFIRISSGTALSTGGSDTHDHGGVTGSHILTTSEIPSHSHTFTTQEGYAGGGSNYPSGRPNTSSPETLQSTSSVGGGGGHTHTVSSANNVPVYVQVKCYKRD